MATARHSRDAEGWDATLDLNAGPCFSLPGAARQMLRQDPDEDGQRGAILHMGSVTSTSPSPTHFATHAYAAAKGAIAALTRTMASTTPEGHPRECRRAGRHPHADGRAGRERPRDRRVRHWKQSLVGGLLEPEHIAGSAAFLLSRDALAITGRSSTSTRAGA